MSDQDFQAQLDQRGRTATDLAPFHIALDGLALLILCHHGPFGYRYRAAARHGDQIAYGQYLHRAMGFQRLAFVDAPSWLASHGAAVTAYPSRPGRPPITLIPLPADISAAVCAWAETHRNQGRRHLVHGQWHTATGQIVVSQYEGRSQALITLELWDTDLACYVCVHEAAGTVAELLTLADAIALLAGAVADPADGDHAGGPP